MSEMENRAKSTEQRLWEFATNKVVVGLLAALVIGMGGYIARGWDNGSVAQASDTEALKTLTNKHEVEIAVLKTSIDGWAREMVRRLDSIDSRLEIRAARQDRQDKQGTELSLRGQPRGPDIAPQPIPGTWPNCREGEDSVRAANGQWFCRKR